MEFGEAFGMTLRHLRLRLGLSQESLSDVAAISTISRIERGLLTPSVDVIEKLALSMKIDPLVLLSLTAIIREGEQDAGLIIARIEKGLRDLGYATERH